MCDQVTRVHIRGTPETESLAVPIWAGPSPMAVAIQTGGYGGQRPPVK